MKTSMKKEKQKRRKEQGINKEEENGRRKGGRWTLGNFGRAREATKKRSEG